MLPVWSSVLIKWAYTVNVVVTLLWPMNQLISSGGISAVTHRLDRALHHLQLILLHEMPSPSSDWTARQPHARGWLG